MWGVAEGAARRRQACNGAPGNRTVLENVLLKKVRTKVVDVRMTENNFAQKVLFIGL